MTKYRKTEEVEARQFVKGETPASLISWIHTNGGRAFELDGLVVLVLPNGNRSRFITPGDWVILNDQGRFRASSEAAFAATFEAIPARMNITVNVAQGASVTAALTPRALHEAGLIR